MTPARAAPDLSVRAGTSPIRNSPLAGPVVRISTSLCCGRPTTLSKSRSTASLKTHPLFTSSLVRDRTSCAPSCRPSSPAGQIPNLRRNASALSGRVAVPTEDGITLRVKFNHRPRVVVQGDGAGLVGQAGGRLPVELAERSGVQAELSRTPAPLAKRVRRRDPARLLVDLAVALAAGGECISDLAVLRQQPELFGEVASTSTPWRVLDSIGPGPLARLSAATARPRTRVWTVAWRLTK